MFLTQNKINKNVACMFLENSKSYIYRSNLCIYLNILNKVE